MKIANIIPQFEFVIAFLFLNFGGTESAGRLSHISKTDVTNIETRQPRKASTEKNIDVIKDDVSKRIVKEYEIELEKELKRRISERKYGRKVKREDSEDNVEELEDRLMQYKLYRIVREKRSPEWAQLVIPDTPGDLMTPLQNDGKNFIQNIKESSTTAGLDILRKLETLQNYVRKVLSPDGTEKESYPKMNNENAEPSGDYVANVTDRLNTAFSGNKNVTFIDLKYSNAEGKDFSSSMKLDDHGTDSTNDNDSSKNKENKHKKHNGKYEEGNIDKSQDSAKVDNAKAGSEKADNAKADSDKADNAKADNAISDSEKADNAKPDSDKADNAKSDSDKADNAKADSDEEDNAEADSDIADRRDRPIYAKDDNDSESDLRNTSSRKSETGLRRKKRNAKKDELVIKTKNKTKEKNKGTKKGEEKDDTEKKVNMECNLKEEKYDEGKNETIKGGKDSDSKSTDAPGKGEEMNDMEDVKEGTDYEEVESDE